MTVLQIPRRMNVLPHSARSLTSAFIVASTTTLRVIRTGHGPPRLGTGAGRALGAARRGLPAAPFDALAASRG